MLQTKSTFLNNYYKKNVFVTYQLLETVGMKLLTFFPDFGWDFFLLLFLLLFIFAPHSHQNCKLSHPFQIFYSATPSIHSNVIC